MLRHLHHGASIVSFSLPFTLIRIYPSTLANHLKFRSEIVSSGSQCLALNRCVLTSSQRQLQRTKRPKRPVHGLHPGHMVILTPERQRKLLRPRPQLATSRSRRLRLEDLQHLQPLQSHVRRLVQARPHHPPQHVRLGFRRRNRMGSRRCPELAHIRRYPKRLGSYPRQPEHEQLQDGRR